MKIVIIRKDEEYKMKQFDQEKLGIAIKYVDRIGDGCNPATNIPLESDTILNDPNMIRCMYFIKDVLEAVQDNNGIVGSRTRKEPMLPFPVEILDEFTYREDKSITQILKQIFEPAAGMKVKRIPATKINAILKEEGYLVDEPDTATGKMRKMPSEKGEELGIYVADREYNGRAYQAVVFDRKAQEYVVELVRRMISWE